MHCGCGNPCRRQFLGGHNGRLKGTLRRSYLLGRRVAVRQALGPDQLVAAAEVADLLGPEWLALVAPDVVDTQEVRDASRASIAAAADAFEAEWGDL